MLPRRRRIPASQFARIFRSGTGSHTPYFAIKRLSDNDLEGFRAAPVVSRKTAKTAVGRHRLRRRVYAVLETLNGAMKPGFWVVVTVKPAAKELPADEFEKELNKALFKAGVLT